MKSNPIVANTKYITVMSFEALMKAKLNGGLSIIEVNKM